MDHFLYRQDELFAEDVPVAAIADQYGTPCYIYSKQTLLRHWHAIDNAFASQLHHICYAVKANGNLSLLKILAELGAGFDIVSGGELARVLAAGAAPHKIAFSGVGKTEVEIEKALSVGIGVFNVESFAEIDRINEIATRLRKTAPIAVRVNPDIKADTHPYIATGLASNKFGIDKSEVVKAYQTIQQKPALKAVGIACHIGSQILELAPFQQALSSLLQLITLLKQHHVTLQHVDLGGGLGVCYDTETPPTLAEYADIILTTLQQQSPYPLELWLEPGRVIMANCGILVTKVQYIKETKEKTFAIVDAGMTDLVRPALYDAHHKIIPVKTTNKPEKTVDLVGPVCESSDFLGKNRMLAIDAGDLLAVRTVGAYGFSMSSQYNARPRAAEVLVDKDRITLIRQRETEADLFNHETNIAHSFVKMQALGNDFVLLDLDNGAEVWSADKIRALSDRHTGIGFDQLLTLCRKSANEYEYRIYNADGGEVAQCGNGARAAALYLKLNNRIVSHHPLILTTHERSMQIDSQDENNFSVNMGKPEFSPAALPLTLAEQKHYDINIEGKRYSFSAVSLGNPHAVLIVDDVPHAPVATIGKAICHHEIFPKEVNVGFMQVLDKHHIALRVYERGAGETQACGSGACAAAVIAIRDGYCQSPVTVKLLGGELMIHWQGKEQSVWMQGDAVYVYKGCV